MAKKKRKANGQGTWFYDENRKLYTFRAYVEEHGETKRMSFSGKTQFIAKEKYDLRIKSIAEEEQRELERKRKEKLGIVESDITVSEYADIWFAEYSPRVEKSTAAGYAFTIKHIKAMWGDIKVNELTASDVEDKLDEMSLKYSQSQCSKVRAMLGQMLDRACRPPDRIIIDNPVKLAYRTNYRRVDDDTLKHNEKDSYDVDETVKVFNNLPDTRIGHGSRLMLGTSMSLQELLGTMSDDIADDGSFVVIKRAVKLEEKSKMYIGAVKAKKRKRKVLVPEAIRPSALFLKNNSKGYIIEGKKSGMPLHPSTFRKFYKAAIKNIGVRYLPPHCCRHTTLSHLQNNNVSFTIIQAVGGQSEKESTIGYLHVHNPEMIKAAKVLDDVFTGKSSVPTSEPTEAQIAQNTQQKPT